jgi:hypothetical protein
MENIEFVACLYKQLKIVQDEQITLLEAVRRSDLLLLRIRLLESLIREFEKKEVK